MAAPYLSSYIDLVLVWFRIPRIVFPETARPEPRTGHETPTHPHVLNPTATPTTRLLEKQRPRIPYPSFVVVLLC